MSMLRMDATFWSTPAEVTRTSVAPCAFLDGIGEGGDAGIVRHVHPEVRCTAPAAAISVAAAFAVSSSMSATTTKSPSSANRFAVARPIPLPPPVTTTIRFPVMPRFSLTLP